MSMATPSEQRILVDLFRSLSPVDLSAFPPPLRPDLEALVGRPLPRRPRAVLFDVYGTLVLSAPGSQGGIPAAEILEVELKEAGYPGGAKLFRRDLALRVSRELTAERDRTPYPEIDIETIIAGMLPSRSADRISRLAVLQEAAANPCAPMPGALSLLTRLASSTLKLGLVSNAQFYTPLLMEALWGARPEDLGFEPGLMIFSYRLRTAKPDPAPFARAAEVLGEGGISPGETLVVGNSSVNDIAPARKRGFMTALFAGDSRSFCPSEPGSSGAQPDLVLQHFTALERCLVEIS